VLTALARDEDGWVAQVEFFAETTAWESWKTGFQTNGFYLNWSNVVAGEYTLTAKATDNFGATRVSEPVHIVVRSGEEARWCSFQGYGLEVPG